MRLRRAISAGLLLVPVVLLGGCLDKPEIEDRWTRLDIAGSSLAANQPVTTGFTQPVSVQVDITYRAILTGFAVAEIRASTIPASDVEVFPEANRVRMAGDIDRILANSVSVGRATRAVTGWDHLIQRVDLSFLALPPLAMDSTGTPPSLFLLCYLGSGVEVEQADGSDSLIVTPFNSTQYELLPVGLELIPVAPGSP